ncbi:hypothetical protein [Vibrio sp. LaRot3]|nr:hypothetical protein [Vibrio sp. LaRot3]MDA0149630.1 hypothetical protein [Vibrio sp. LaRot3]
MYRDSATSLFIYARRNITIEQVTITIQDLIGNVEIELVAEE